MDEVTDIVVVGKIDYDKDLAKLRAKMRSQSLTKSGDRILLPKIKVQVKAQVQLNSDLKDAIA